jgi:hypothetical protein
MKKLFLALLVLFAAFTVASAQRTSVSSSEVSGTFRLYFSGGTKGDYNQAKISSIGKSKLKVSLELIYPYVDSNGQKTANLGEAEGTAELVGDTAVFTPEGAETCKIIIKFVKPGQIKITEDGGENGCGFGRNVYSDGVYIKVINKKRAKKDFFLVRNYQQPNWQLVWNFKKQRKEI